MKVIVLMSSYNGELYISEQIDSILNQIGEFELELIVRDDGSTDKTIGILKEYAGLNRLSWYSSGNVGPQNSFFDLLQNSGDADYYAFADQDDVWNKNKIARGIEMLEYSENIPSVYFSNAEIVDGKLNSTNKNVYTSCPALDLCTLAISGGILGCTMIFNHKMMQLIRINKETPRILMHDFYIALLCKAHNGNLIYDEKCNMKYRQHGSNVVGVNTKDNIFARLKKDISKKYVYSIADQADYIIANYNLENQSYDWLNKVSKYKNSFVNRLKLATSTKTKYGSVSSSIINRLSLMMGNR